MLNLMTLPVGTCIPGGCFFSTNPEYSGCLSATGRIPSFSGTAFGAMKNLPACLTQNNHRRSKRSRRFVDAPS